ncbi:MULTISPECIES: hypothetical protein [Actinomycetes]|uniref:hypothetical protein n=1 Tax=Actinomycetes TaxID=1760 RepID=UPI0013314517|nr:MULTISPECIES: hypothetical protein [Actinomycetes]
MPSDPGLSTGVMREVATVPRLEFSGVEPAGVSPTRPHLPCDREAQSQRIGGRP